MNKMLRSVTFPASSGASPSASGSREALTITKLAANQPYLFPYIGYFQLIRSVDVFVIYDDVNYIQRGWINRNRILVQGKPYLFSVPILDHSCFREIRETCVSPTSYTRWREKYSLTLHRAYGKAPHYPAVQDLVDEVLTVSVSTIADMARVSILKVCEYLGIVTQIRRTSSVYGNHDLQKETRLYDICHCEGADTYVNSIGGTELYSREEFLRQGISLVFLRSRDIEYKQWGKPFVPNLSIIDVMMFNSVSDIRAMLDQFDLI
jgi:hypothetical protein